MNTKVEMINVDELKTSPIQPPNRIQHHSIAGLKNSIKDHGILQPILVAKDFTIIDGHRRVACAIDLGIKSVPCIFSDLDYQTGFIETNSFTRKISTQDDLFVYLTGGKMTGRSKKNIVILESIIGRDGLEKMVEQNYAPGTIFGSLAIIMPYLFPNMPKSLMWTSGNNPYAKKVANWMIKHRESLGIRTAVSMKMPPETIKMFIDADKPLPI